MSHLDQELPRILIVDDDLDFARLVQISLSETGMFHAIVEHDCEFALQRIRDSEPDLVILDLMMPKKNGGWLFQRLKEDQDLCKIPVIVLSAIVERRDNQFFPERDMVGMINLWKPVDPNVLIGAILAELEARKQRESKAS